MISVAGLHNACGPYLFIYDTRHNDVTAKKRGSITKYRDDKHDIKKHGGIKMHEP